MRLLPNYARLTANALSRIVLGAASATIVAGLAIWTWCDFADARHDAETKISATTVAMCDLARWSLGAIDGVVDSVIARIDEIGLDKLTSESELARLRRVVKNLPEASELSVVNSAGDTVAAAPLAMPINVSDRKWFGALRDGKAGYYVGRAQMGRVIHRIFFPVARSIWGPDGNFFGAVEVGVGMTFLAHLFHSLDFGSGAIVGFYRTADGVVIARAPMTEAQLNETVATLPYFAALANSDGQSWMGWSQNGGEAHLVSARRLDSWPLIVSVSLTKGEVYSDAWWRLLGRSAVAAMILVGLLALAALTARQATREAMLMGELEHRVKNMLGVVGAVIDRASEDAQSVQQFVSSLRGRIQSMADTHTLLSRNRWKGASLADLISAELKPYSTGSNTSIEGPIIHLTPNASHAVAMVVHELTTNAAKYGALARPSGHVAVTWALAASSATRLKIDWRETGGPTVAMPTRQGYGSGVIRDLLAYEFGGRVDVSFAANGLRCTIELPANAETLN